MKIHLKLALLGTAATLLGGAGALRAQEPAALSAAGQGREIAFDRNKGNCLACHMIEGGQSPGDIGPPLVGISARFPDKAKLYAKIYDATANNPNTMMPPFGRHMILSADELAKVVEFIYSL